MKQKSTVSKLDGLDLIMTPLHTACETLGKELTKPPFANL